MTRKIDFSAHFFGLVKATLKASTCSIDSLWILVAFRTIFIGNNFQTKTLTFPCKGRKTSVLHYAPLRTIIFFLQKYKLALTSTTRPHAFTNCLVWSTCYNFLEYGLEAQANRERIRHKFLHISFFTPFFSERITIDD